MKLVQLFILLGCVFAMQSQVKVTDIRGNFGKVKQSFNVEDVATGNFAVFLEGNDRVYGILYNSDFEELSRISALDLSSKFKSILGYQIEGKEVSLLMSTLNGKSYGMVQFDFETGYGTSKELDFKLKGEKVIDAVTYNNTVYLLTLPNFSSQLNFYSFKNMLKPTVIEVKFADEAFLDRKERSRRLYDILKDSEISSVEIGEPNSLEVTSKEIKLYQNGRNLIITSDDAIEFTYVINIDLQTFEKQVRRFEKPTIDGFKMGLRTNSFVNDGKLFQLIANSDILKFRVFSLISNEILKEYTLTDDEELYLKNTPIVQEGGEFKAYRELETTNQFLRKTVAGDIGISVYKTDGKYQITMGSTAEKENGYVIMGGALGGMVGAVLVSSINQLTTSYSLYKNTKSVKITGLFNENLNHVEGDVPLNPFDVIKASLDKIDGTQAETIFKVGDDYVFGFFAKKVDVYSLYKL